MKSPWLRLAVFLAMTPAVLAPCAVAQSLQRLPAIPLPNPDPDFPLRVYILTVHWGGDNMHLYRSLRGEMRGGPGYFEPTGSAHGYGTANILQDPAQGVDFAFDCHSAFQPNHQPQEFYQARWKRPGQSLEILMQPVGASHGDLCELKVVLKQHPFDPSSLPSTNGPGNSTLNGRLWNEPEAPFTGSDPDYPVHLHILTSFHRIYENGVQGYGTANIDGSVIQGADYNYNCSHGLLANTQPLEDFQGHWVKPNERLEILLQRFGSDHVDRCQLNISVRGTPYPESSVSVPATAPDPASTPSLIRK